MNGSINDTVHAFKSSNKMRPLLLVVAGAVSCRGEFAPPQGLASDVTSETPSHLVQSMNAWAGANAAALRVAAPAAVTALENRMDMLGKFCGSNFPRLAHSLPVLYLFSGMDLLTAHGCFPRAPRYILLADFPTGHTACFGSPTCLRRAKCCRIAGTEPKSARW